MRLPRLTLDRDVEDFFNAPGRVIEYVAADRALAREYIACLVADKDETPEWAAANDRVCDAEEALPARLVPVVEWLAGLVNNRLYRKAWDLEDELDRAEAEKAEWDRVDAEAEREGSES